MLCCHMLETSFAEHSVDDNDIVECFGHVNLWLHKFIMHHGQGRLFSRLHGKLLTPRGMCSMYVCGDGFYGIRLHFRRARVGVCV